MENGCNLTLKTNIAALGFSVKTVMSVWLPVKMRPWDRQFTYLVLDVASSLIIYICYT